MSLLERIVALAESLDQTSYYDLLDVAPGAAGDEIERGYYRVAGRLHPDRFAKRAAPDQRAALDRVFARLGEARRVLGTAALRADYDRSLAGGGHQRLGEESPTRPEPVLPRHPMARQLYEQARPMIEAGDAARARQTLELARQYEPTSPAIAEALARVALPPRASAPPSPARPAVTKAVAPIPAASPPAAVAPPLAAAPDVAARAHPRVAVAIPVKLKLSRPDEFETFVTRDVSRGGMFLSTATPVALGARLDLTVVAPSGVEIALPAEVVRVISDGPHPGLGLRFLELSEAVRAVLDAFTGVPPAAAAAVEPAEHVDLKPAAQVAQPMRRAAAPPPRGRRALPVETDHVLARAVLAEALRQTPDDSRLRAAFHVASGFEALAAGQRDEARREFATALLHDSQCEEAIRALREL